MKKIANLIWGLMLLLSIPTESLAQFYNFNVYLSPRNVVPPQQGGSGFGEMRLQFDSVNCNLNVFPRGFAVDAGDSIENVVIRTIIPGRKSNKYQKQIIQLSIPFTIAPDNPHLGVFPFSSINLDTLPVMKYALLNDSVSAIVYTTKSDEKGALRGGLARDFGVSGLTSYIANLFGFNNSPPINSRGQGSIEGYTAGPNLLLSGSFTLPNINQFIMATLNIGLPGQPGQVIDTLIPKIDTTLNEVVFKPIDNGFELDFNELNQLFQGLFFINILTENYPEGELRGHLYNGTSLHQAILTGMHAIPKVFTDASGKVDFLLERDSVLNVVGSIKGLSGDFVKAEIRSGPVGREGPAVFDLVFGPDPDNKGGTFVPFFNSFAVDKDFRDKLKAGELYLSIKTTKYDEELRGNLLPEAQMRFEGFISSSQLVPPLGNDILGQITLSMQDKEGKVYGSVRGLDDFDPLYPGEVVMKYGLPGALGSFFFPLTFLFDPDNKGLILSPNDNIFELDEFGLNLLLGLKAFVEFDTQSKLNRARGNIGGVANEVYYSGLSGVLPKETKKTTGQGGFQIWKSGPDILLAGNFTNLNEPTDSTIEGKLGLYSKYFPDSLKFDLKIPYTFDSDLNAGQVEPDTVITLSPRLDSLLRRGSLFMGYIPDSSEAMQTREIGGIFASVDKQLFYANLKGENVANPAVTLGKGRIFFDLCGDTLIYRGSFSGLFGQTTTDGTKIYKGKAGINGPEVFTLLNTFSGPVRTEGTLGNDPVLGQIKILLSEADKKSLRNGDFYVSIDSDNYPNGEIRGQILPNFNYFPEVLPLITSPATNDSVSINATTGMGFTINWNPGKDNEQDSLNYIVEIALDPTFFLPLVFVNTSNNTSYTLTAADVIALDTTLNGMGVMTGETANIYIRVSVSDGSECLQALGSTFTVERQTTTNAISSELAKDYQLSLYPSPVNDLLKVSLQTEKSGRGRLSIWNVNGKRLISRNIEVSGSGSSAILDVSALSTGLYWLRLEVSEGILAGKAFLKK